IAVMNFEKRRALNKNFVAVAGVELGFVFMDDTDQDEISFAEYGYAANYMLGGNLVRPRKDDVVFPGLNEGELPVTQFMALKGAIQYSPAKNFFLTPHFHIASIGYNDFSDYIENAFSPDGEWYLNNEVSALISAGITASYNSFIGPVDLDVSWVNGIDKVRLFFGIGYQFNRSN
ncbi:MAG: patatin, partial [Flavobacteriaceae bacterium]|nr:patatin [Flavobacteriaceae bacterium]